jgi:flagellar basal-body rod protein FlgB
VITGLDAVTNDLGRLALDQAWYRQQAIAANIANHATPGYKALRVDFETVVAEIGSQIRSGASDGQILETIDRARGRMRLEATDAPVQLDEQMVELTKNSLHYLSVLTAIEKYGSIKSVAVRGESR